MLSDVSREKLGNCCSTDCLTTKSLPKEARDKLINQQRLEKVRIRIEYTLGFFYSLNIGRKSSIQTSFSILV